MGCESKQSHSGFEVAVEHLLERRLTEDLGGDGIEARIKLSACRRVLMVVENCSYPRDCRVSREALALSRAGYTVSVVCPSEPGLPWREVVEGILVYRYPSPPDAHGFLGYLWEYAYSFVAAFSLSLLTWMHPGFDIIHAANPPDTAFIIAAFYKLFGKCFVYDQHDLAPEVYYAHFEGKGNQLVYRVLIWLERLSCGVADHIIAANQSYKGVEMERGRVSADRITVVRNGPDPNQLLPGEPISGLKQEGKNLIVYVGRIEFQDGVDYLLRALRHLANDLGRSDFLCIIVGDGGALPTVKRLSGQLGLAGSVSFTGWLEQQEIMGYLNSADICVAPEPSNEFNDRSTMVKIMEYMAMGRPVVAFDLPEHRFTAQDAALYAKPNDELDMARQIARLMDNPKLRTQMGQIGRERVESELAWTHQEKHLLEAYESVLSRSR